MVDLPPDANVAAINSITLPEHAADIDLNIPLAGDITFEYVLSVLSCLYLKCT